MPGARRNGCGTSPRRCLGTSIPASPSGRSRHAPRGSGSSIQRRGRCARRARAPRRRRPRPARPRGCEDRGSGGTAAWCGPRAARHDRRCPRRSRARRSRSCGRSGSRSPSFLPAPGRRAARRAAPCARRPVPAVLGGVVLQPREIEVDSTRAAARRARSRAVRGQLVDATGLDEKRALARAARQPDHPLEEGCPHVQLDLLRHAQAVIEQVGQAIAAARPGLDLEHDPVAAALDAEGYLARLEMTLQTSSA